MKIRLSFVGVGTIVGHWRLEMYVSLDRLSGFVRLPGVYASIAFSLPSVKNKLVVLDDMVVQMPKFLLDEWEV